MKRSLIKAILIDDEAAARNVLESLLIRSCPEVEILAICEDMETGVLKIKQHKPDLVFLDVQMPNYAGYEIVKFFDKLDFDIVFVTAYDQYAIKAFELNAIDYLVKPVKRQRLIEAVSKVSERVASKVLKSEYQHLLKSMEENKFDRIVVPELGNRRILDIPSIVAIEADGAYSKIYEKDGTVTISSKNLKYFESALEDNSTFFRSHRTWLINLQYIQSFNKANMSVKLSEGNLNPRLSRHRLKEFEAVFR